MALVKKYSTIQADPPWPYRQKLDRPTTRGGLKYPTMSVEEIMAIPVQGWATEDCQCWLWSTNSHLHDAFHILEAWGFRYITCCTWVKTKMGLGYWLRGKTEHLLLGARGNPRSKFIGPHGSSGYDYSTFIYAPPQGHSKKPAVAYDMIEALSEEPRLDLFARSYRLGWDAWGDEVGVHIGNQGKSGSAGPDVDVVMWLRQGECNRCGDCCRVENLPQRLEVYKKWGLAALVKPVPCPHFQDGTPTACLIYTDRPLMCQVFPRHPADIEALPRCSYRFVKGEVE